MKIIHHAGEMFCPYNFLKLGNMGITYLHKKLYKSLHMAEDTK